MFTWFVFNFFTMKSTYTGDLVKGIMSGGNFVPIVVHENIIVWSSNILYNIQVSAAVGRD